MRHVIATLLAFTLLGCAKDPSDQLREEAFESVKRQLIDPTSPLLEEVISTTSFGGYLCGTVNGKNRMGAYAGKHHFMYHAGMTVIADEGEMEDALFYCCLQVVDAANSNPPVAVSKVAQSGCEFAKTSEMLHPSLRYQPK